MARVEVCHPELALRSLLCQFWSPYAYDAPWHSLCCLQYITLAVTVQAWIIVECLSVFWRQMGLSSHRARLEYHQDSFQDACVNHNKFDADNESVTRMHTPHSKSSVEGILNHNHESRNRIPSSTIVGYVACYG